MAEEVKALRENATKREALASKFLVGLRTLYVNTLASDGKKEEANRKADEIFGDIHDLSQKAAQAFKGMVGNNPQPERQLSRTSQIKSRCPLLLRRVGHRLSLKSWFVYTPLARSNLIVCARGRRVPNLFPLNNRPRFLRAT